MLSLHLITTQGRVCRSVVIIGEHLAMHFHPLA